MYILIWRWRSQIAKIGYCFNILLVNMKSLGTHCHKLKIFGRKILVQILAWAGSVSDRIVFEVGNLSRLIITHVVFINVNFDKRCWEWNHTGLTTDHIISSKQIQALRHATPKRKECSLISNKILMTVFLMFKLPICLQFSRLRFIVCLVSKRWVEHSVSHWKVICFTTSGNKTCN